MSDSDITAERLREVLHYDPETGVFTWRVSTTNRVQVGEQAGVVKSNGYVQIGLYTQRYYAHRLAWLYAYGVWPTDEIDHANRRRADNRITNLRLASRPENSQNHGLSKRNSSGHTGVRWRKEVGLWHARISRDYREVHLGYFGSVSDAVAARKAAESEYHPFRR